MPPAAGPPVPKNWRAGADVRFDAMLPCAFSRMCPVRLSAICKLLKECLKTLRAAWVGETAKSLKIRWKTRSIECFDEIIAVRNGDSLEMEFELSRVS